MQSAIQTTPRLAKGKLVGHLLSGFAALFLLLDGVIHVLNIPPVVEASAQLGIPAGAAVGLGIVELLCLAAYLLPRTSLLGAVLLTGYLGGAVAIHMRVESPLFSHLLFPVYLGAMVWGGLYLRDPRLRAVLSSPSDLS